MSKLVLAIIAAGAFAGGIYFVTRKSTEEKRLYLQALDNRTAPFDQMTDGEISDTYTFITEYANRNVKLTEDNPLWARIVAISKKYNIFT